VSHLRADVSRRQKNIGGGYVVYTRHFCHDALITPLRADAATIDLCRFAMLT